MGSAISVTGQIAIWPRRGQSADQNFFTELTACAIDRLSPSAAHIPPEANKANSHNSLSGAMSHSMPKPGLLRSEKGLPWRHRLPPFAAMLRLRAASKSLVHTCMQSRNYLEVCTILLRIFKLYYLYTS